MLSATVTDATTVVIGSGSTSLDSGGSATSSGVGDGSSQNSTTSNYASGAISQSSSSSDSASAQTSATVGNGSVSPADSASGSGSGGGSGTSTGSETGTGSGTGPGSGSGSNAGVLIATDDYYFDLANDITSFIAGSVLNNDTDTRPMHQSLVATLLIQASHGTVTLDQLGMFTYAIQDNTFGGDDAFTYQVSDGVSSSNATVTISVVRATILDGNGSDVSNNKLNPTNIWDGQQASVSASVVNAPPGVPITYSWTYTGDPIKNYDISTNTVSYLQPKDLSQAGAPYYYYNASGLESATVTVTLNGQIASFSTYFDVSRPTVKLTADPGTWWISYDPTISQLRFNNVSFTATGGQDNPPGSMQFIQVIDSTSIYQSFTNGTPPVTFNTTNTIDYSSPYPNVKGNYTLFDNPGNFVNRAALDYFRRDFFSDYVMFTPTNGIAVPVKRFDWNWYAEVSYVERVGLKLMDHPNFDSGNITDISDYPPEFAINDPNNPKNQSWTAAQWAVLKQVGIFP